MGIPADDSVRAFATGRRVFVQGHPQDSDVPTRTPRKPFTAGAGGGLFAAGGGLFPTDLAAAAGTPSNLGKVSDAGMSQRSFIVTFSLSEMVTTTQLWRTPTPWVSIPMSHSKKLVVWMIVREDNFSLFGYF